MLAEYTSQQTNVFRKFTDDLRKCFDETKTGIPLSRIRAIILCHNTKLDAEDELRLIDQCKSHGIECLLFGISDISLELYNHHRALARDFLGVTIDTGQILDRSDFVREYNKSAVAPPIDTVFRFRASEMDQALAALDESPLVIIAGKAGVGKTRFAIECADRFAATHPETAMRAVYNRGVSVFDDVLAYFGPPGHYLVLVDDANRLAGLDHVLQLLRTAGPDRNVRIIATVRDYAVDKIVNAARPYGKHGFIVLNPLSDQQIRELAREACDVQHHVFLDRIATIAQGNPRLAIMAARATERAQSFEAVRDASTLYDVYFESIRSDLGALGNEGILAAAGIVAFFRVVDRSNAEMMNIIEQKFGIPAAAFWDAVKQLHALELVDVHENDVVRLSDQVLATYLFYLTFFKSRQLSFGALLSELFPRFRNRLMDALRPVAETFSNDMFMEESSDARHPCMAVFEALDDESALLHLIDSFGSLRPTEALLFAKNKIDHMLPEPATVDTPPTTRAPDSSIQSPSILSILQSFQSADESDTRMAVELVCEYVAKRPADRERILHLFEDVFGMDALFIPPWVRTRALGHRESRGTRTRQRNCAIRWAFLDLAESYLHHRIQSNESRWPACHYDAIVAVPLTPELKEFRKSIWRTAFTFFDDVRYQGAVLRMLSEQGRGAHMFSGGETICADAPTLLELISSRLDPSHYPHCATVQKYLDTLDQYGVNYDAALRQRFRSETLTFAETLIGTKLDRTELDGKNSRPDGLQAYEPVSERV